LFNPVLGGSSRAGGLADQLSTPIDIEIIEEFGARQKHLPITGGFPP